MALDLRLALGAVLSLAACSSPDAHSPASSTPTTAEAASGAVASEPVKSTPSTKPSANAKTDPIGQATLLADGTIVLDLYRPAMAQVKYAKNDPKYQSILDHVGPLEVGKPKPVAPWADDIDDAKVADAVTAYVKSKRGWGAGEWSQTIVGTDADGNVAVNVTFNKDLESKTVGGGKSFQLILAAKDYAVVREKHFQ